MALCAPAPVQLRVRSGYTKIEVVVGTRSNYVFVKAAKNCIYVSRASTAGLAPEQALTEAAPLPVRLRVGCVSKTWLVVVDRVFVISGTVGVLVAAIAIASTV